MNQIKKGFSLLEQMVVILVIGVLVTAAVLQYAEIVEKTRRTEAAVILHEIQKSELRYHQSNGTYTQDTSALDIDWPAGRYFSYEVTYAAASEFTCQATRTDVERPESVAVYILEIDQDGNITEN